MMKAGDGRPRSHNRRKTCVIAFRVTPEVETELSEAAMNDGFDSVGLWAKAFALNAIRRPDAEKKVLRMLMGELGKVGSDIKKIAQVANSTGHLPDEAILRQMGSVMNSVYLVWPMRVSDTVTH
ncbi:hypothetical protein [Loktanella sp. SALINAS62]|uniref:hypothetical protein n=1 Tax=Loktanella sp. SALINAS62 TaxID=2706124 RepID=UPI001B8BBC4F|nr:hypothetical protein [Loktanella sp. SALINAS62]MBS1301720.1 hypothetical protein [Loktanella sp. SALINAS62]